jgi:hypothetical protein
MKILFLFVVMTSILLASWSSAFAVRGPVEGRLDD